MARTDDDDLSGRTVGRYSILARIAKGGQGQVYRGRDEALRREVAVKVLSAARLADPAARRGLMHEARVLSRLNHPHIAGIYDFVTEGGRDFMVMELVSGATLTDVLAAGPLPASEVLRLGAQLARGLAAAHAAHVVHCDVKPGNIKITSAGELKILDFGIARLLPAAEVLDNAPQTAVSDTVLGTVPYMAPEQIRGDAPEPRSDIFSLGTVLYEMATGFRAFQYRNVARLIDAVQHEDPPPPSSLNPLIPLRLEEVIVGAMEKDPSARPAAALDVALSLDELLPARRDVPDSTPARAIRAALAGGFPWSGRVASGRMATSR